MRPFVVRRRAYNGLSMSESAPATFNFSQDVFLRWARQMPDGIALWCLDEVNHTEQRFTFAEMGDRLRRAASFFLAMGIRPGDRVLMVLPRMPEWWVCMLGLTYIGAVPIPGTPMLTEKDLEYRFIAAGPAAVIANEECAAKIDSAVSVGNPVRIYLGGSRPGWTTFTLDADPSPPAIVTRSDDPGLMYFTSGTSGPPKMALHTQASYAIGHRVTGEHWLCLKPGDVHWVLADVGWGKAAWSAFFGPWQMGATVFTAIGPGKFHPKTTLKTLSRYPINSFCAPPTALRLLVAEDLAWFRFPNLRHCTAAGESLTPDILIRWQNATGMTIHEGYGQTETTLLVGSFARSGRPVRPGSMGHPAPGMDIRLLDQDLNEVPAGREGSLVLRVAPDRPIGLFREYFNDPAETASRFRGGFYFTGDMARRDEEGYFYFLGRADDVINSASYRIGPYEVESALATHPAVLESAVVAHPDPLRGEVVKAYVVLRGGEPDDADAMRHELQEHCKKMTAPYKYPRLIEFIGELPKTTNGKIRRAALRKLAQAAAL